MKKVFEIVQDQELYVVAKLENETIGGSISDLAEMEADEVLLVTSSVEEAKSLVEPSVNEEVKLGLKHINNAIDMLDDGDLKFCLYEAKKEIFAILKSMEIGALAESESEMETEKPVIVPMEEAKEKIKSIIESYFPDGKISFGKPALSNYGFFVDFSLGKEPNDYPNKIRLNDIFFTSFYFGIPENYAENFNGKYTIRSSGHNVGGLQINGSKVKKFNWRNCTVGLNSIYKRLNDYFKEARDFLDTDEGKEIIQNYKSRL